MAPDLPPPPFDCGTDFSLARPALVSPPPPATGAKLSRDAFDLPNASTSENFAFRWGDGAQVSEDEARAILQHFEDSWDHQVDGWDYPAPATSDATLFNVYLGSSGPGSPDDHGYGGYFTYDLQGYPMIVLNRQSVVDPGGMYMVVSHEFFHAIQDATPGYQYTGRAAWYYEATAVWASGEMYPYDETHASFLIGYAYLPQLPIHFFDYPDTGALEEYHQYGAFIFPQFLTEHVADPGLVRDSWVEPDDDDPLVVLDGLLREDWGADIEGAFADFAAHNAAWDYALGEVYADWEEAYDGFWPEEKLLASHGGWSEGWREVSGELAPRRFGSNFIRLIPTDDEDVVVGFEGDDTGSAGAAPVWWVTLVTRSGGALGYFPLALEGGALAEQAVAGTGGAEEAWLVVSATSEEAGDNELFGYRYTLGVEPQEVEYEVISSADETAGAKGCGCSGAGGLPGAGLLGILGLLGVIRRR